MAAIDIAREIEGALAQLEALRVEAAKLEGELRCVKLDNLSRCYADLERVYSNAGTAEERLRLRTRDLVHVVERIDHHVDKARQLAHEALVQRALTEDR